MAPGWELRGLDGTNPLGFLAALGTLVCLHEGTRKEARLGWRMAQQRWLPVLQDVDAEDGETLVSAVAEALRGKTVPADAEARRAAAQREMEQAQTAVKKKREELRKRKLRGSERSEAIDRELRPLQDEYDEKRREWLEALREAVPRPELALGKKIDCTKDEFRNHATGLIGLAHRSSREALDMLASFGTDAIRQANSDVIQPTPFCFITGSGHQFFLETARELMAMVSVESVRRTLLEPWDYRDEGLSMRWDPIEDRRYALMDRDPTASGNKPRTMWMANLLAYRGLALFTSAPMGRRLQTVGWDADHTSFTWPLWNRPLSLDGVRSLLELRELVEERPDARAMRARGIVAIYRAQRIEVGTGANRKVNFSPARRVA